MTATTDSTAVIAPLAHHGAQAFRQVEVVSSGTNLARMAGR
jgi:hypothetical protein